MTSLSERLNAALDRDDRRALVSLYIEATESASDERQISFFLTHAYVHALETGQPIARDLRARLVSLGCESP